MRSMNRWGMAAASLCLAAAIGCSDGMARIEGVVTLDGEPLAGEGISATVVFEPLGGGPKAYAVVGDGGEFRAATGSATGVQPGEYAIAVRGKRVEPNPNPNYPPRSVPITPPRYANSHTSGFKIDAQGSHELALDLSSTAQ